MRYRRMSDSDVGANYSPTTGYFRCWPVVVPPAAFQQ